MRIAILDSYACDFDGLSWDRFNILGEVAVFPRTDQEKLIERSLDCEAVIVNKVSFDAEALKQLPKLRYIGVTATGVNNVDLEAARELSITVTNVPNYGSAAVSQMVFAHVLNLYSQVAEYNSLAKSGAWSQSPDFCLHAAPITELAGKTIGIVGYGSIGRRVAAIAEAFGMGVLVAAIPGRDYTIGELPERHALRSVLQRSDIVTLHCALSRDTQEIINKNSLSFFKRGSILINTARGALVDEDALADALSAGQLQAACIDVLRNEPPLPGNRLLHETKVRLTPHIAWATREARERLIDETYVNLEAFLAGCPRNVVS